MCRVCASKTWSIRVEEEQRMEGNEHVMLRWLRGITLRDKVPTVELRRRLGIEGVVEVMRRADAMNSKTLSSARHLNFKHTACKQG